MIPTITAFEECSRCHALHRTSPKPKTPAGSRRSLRRAGAPGAKNDVARPRPAEAPGSRPDETGRTGRSPAPSVNVGDAERRAVGAGRECTRALRPDRVARRLALAAVGGALLYRGLSGHCDCFAALGISTAKKRRQTLEHTGRAGVRVDKTITINRPASAPRRG